MKHAAAVILVAFITAACAAGEPQNDTVRNDARMHLWTASELPSDARQIMNDGIHEEDMNHPAEAYQHFQRVIAADSTSAIAEAYAANAAWGFISTQTVMKHSQRAIALQSHATPLEQAVINTFDRIFHVDFAAALEQANKVASLAPDNPRSWMLLATVDSVLGNTAKSRADLQKALDVAPDFAPVYVALASTYTGSTPRDLTKAERYARKAVELEPEEAVSYDALGDALRQQGKLTEAAVAYTKQAALDPTDGNGLQQRAHVNSFLGHYAEARADYDASASVSSGLRRSILIAYKAFVAGFEGHPTQQFDELEAMYKEAGAATYDGSDELRSTLAGWQMVTALEEHNAPEMKIAAQNYRDASAKIASDVGTPDMQLAARQAVPFSKAYEALLDNNFAAATALAHQYNSMLNESDTPSKWFGHELLGDIALQQKQYALASKEYDQANPNDPFIWYCHALALEGDNRTEEAQKIYTTLTNYYFNNPGVSLIRAKAQAKLKKAA